MAKRLSNQNFFKQVLESWGEEVAKAGKDAVAKGAEKIAADAKALCPVDTGKLRDSIHVEYKKEGAIASVVADAETGEGYYYGRIVEYSPCTGKPFLTPAIDSNASSIRNDVIAAMREASRKALK